MGIIIINDVFEVKYVFYNASYNKTIMNRPIIKRLCKNYYFTYFTK